MMVDETRFEETDKTFSGTMEDAFETVMHAAGEWGSNVAEMTKEKPLTALLVALSLGFVVRALTHTRHR